MQRQYKEATSRKMWRKLGGSLFGRWLYSKILCFKAPYFGTIKPQIICLESGVCEIAICQRRAVQNHIGTIHAIALCNLVELSAGLMVDASLPNGMRWIPKGMTVKYLQKAKGKITARATSQEKFQQTIEAYSHFVQVILTDESKTPVLEATVEMWVSERK